MLGKQAGQVLHGVEDWQEGADCDAADFAGPNTSSVPANVDSGSGRTDSECTNIDTDLGTDSTLPAASPMEEVCHSSPSPEHTFFLLPLQCSL